MAENDRFLSRKTGKAPGKSNFAQACTLLGQFLKEKRNLGVVVSGNGEISKEKLPETSSFRPPVATKNFLTNMGSQAGPSTVQSGAVSTSSTMVKSSEFFQQFKGFGAPQSSGLNVEDANKADLRKSTTSSAVVRPETAQMTIFYKGQVLVFNDLPANKANEVMALARKGSSNISGSVSTTPVPVVLEEIDLSKPPASEPDIIINTPIPKSDNNNNNTLVKDNNNDKEKHESLQQRPADQAVSGSDLPIARRNSLHRFLGKRKDRVAAKAPYQVVNHRPVAAPPKPDEGNQLQEGECSDMHLELKL